ncbi:NAD+ synthase [Candidatus Atelocyanobacterium thalassae]|uniref:Glutamine-dependent NAD(+) synthetase n=1 Tax=Atelocyanobacterium thalassa (isolate ALOHA) TaxID=1453429 RepID=D3EQC8_ATETH|nr:NAD+ synthase [Candidatus Atelocyanobacterium thalassa]ADB95678.1 NH(3)-dependent NAD(+) synthetase [Candidatus Atelocyanobacterium thalassa isolate ALOHA]MCH2543102.1 NAD+ synthase [Candidatus Atelocyanobacterium sp. ALOHA_A2.5_9]|tara:strand:- start:85738 stop:87423 length:1686 start_codon:yes stop_codon:yes gene_type:complete
MKILIAQLNPIVGNLKYNADSIYKSAILAKQKNVELLLTPELSLCGYPPKDLVLNTNFIQNSWLELQKLAKKIPPKLAVLVGLVTKNYYSEIKGEKPLFNSIVLLQNNAIKQIFHKRLLPNYDVFDEKHYFESGKVSSFFELSSSSKRNESSRIGVTICEDLWNEESFWSKRNYKNNPIRDLVRYKVDLIVNLSASPYVINKQKTRESILKHSAKLYQTPIIYVNQIGGNDDLIFDGHSCAVNKKGEVVLRTKGFQIRTEIIEYHQSIKDLTLSLNKNSITAEEEVWSALVLGLKDYVIKCGFSKVVLGLSGGIDSSLVASIAVEALGAKNVLGILMPSPYSSQHSITDAKHLADNLGINSYMIPIDNIMLAYTYSLDVLFKTVDIGIAEENLQSRIRGNILMAIANKFGHLLLSTGNKSEISIGYCTLYGDMNGGIGVIADVSKTQVFSLCKWLNKSQEIIPINILLKPPSAELKPNQVDQDSLPSYNILDDLLNRFINHHQSIQELHKVGFEYDLLYRVAKLIIRAEFKRKQAPPGLKITNRAFGTGWRMPIASQLELS